MLKALNSEGILWLSRVCQVMWKFGSTKEWRTRAVARERLLNRGAENIKYKFRFAQKWPIICINQ